jgi:glyceraldehyde 3-phosphate dehydrogenase
LGKIIPEISGKIRGTSVRVPVSNVSMVDLNITFNDKTTKKDFFKMIEEVSGDVITVSEEDSVSSDFIGYESPSVIDYNSTYQVSDRTLKITLWYDNEWSYASQMIRMCRYIFKVTKNE